MKHSPASWGFGIAFGLAGLSLLKHVDYNYAGGTLFGTNPGPVIYQINLNTNPAPERFVVIDGIRYFSTIDGKNLESIDSRLE